MPRIKLIHLKPSVICAALITLAGFIGIIDVHEVIPGSHLFDWLTLPFLYGGFALGVMTSDLAAWLSIAAGFALWVFLFAMMFSSRWWVKFRKSWPI